MPTTHTATEIKAANTHYHDAAAAHYDSKWGIDFTPAANQRVLTTIFTKALPDRGRPLARRALEIGAGTGYCSLNLLLAGALENVVCTDISSGMLVQLSESAQQLGLTVQTVVTDGERLPFTDASFDLVFGHAVLHHLPDLPQAFAEFMRVLEPGGAFAFAGEPSRLGDRLAQLPKRSALAVAPSGGG